MPNQTQRPAGSRIKQHQSADAGKRSVAPPPALRMSHIQQLRKMLDELEIKLDAQMCLQHNGRHRYARRIPVDQSAGEILRSLRDLVDSHLARPVSPIAATIGNHQRRGESDQRRDRSTVRIQLKLSPALVRVLQTVRQERVKASELVESVLWSSPRVQDTALLAGIRPPGQAPAA
ncbi:MAG: hypothetical protein ABGZ35_03420 [Planctomycetaceae bacterium]|jgi:hypothetical protein